MGDTREIANFRWNRSLSLHDGGRCENSAINEQKLRSCEEAAVQGGRYGEAGVSWRCKVEVDRLTGMFNLQFQLTIGGTRRMSTHDNYTRYVRRVWRRFAAN